MKKYETISILSNIIFIVPTVFAFVFGMNFIASMFGILFVTSTSYHFYKPKGLDWWWNRNRTKLQTSLLYLDTIVGILTFSILIFRLTITGLTHFSIFGIILFIIGLCIMLYPKGNYQLQHSLWHISAGIAAVLILM